MERSFHNTWSFEPDLHEQNFFTARREEMTDPLKKKIRTRVAHKAYVTKTLGDIKKNEENLKPEERAKIINLKSSLEEQYEAIKALDND